ncbi:hypothetical protein [Nocardia cyriacigeorgica]|uniref:hypothetical protein n=1 Tax=Nocardia cyriacigeorgica TaxID=135487 RepID=UPI003CC7E220
MGGGGPPAGGGAGGAGGGVDPALAAPALATVDVPGRMQRVERGQDFLALVDYAHTASASSPLATL